MSGVPVHDAICSKPLQPCCHSLLRVASLFSEPAGDVPAPEATYVPPSGVAGMLPMALLSVLPLMAAGALLLA